jgi:hypothetical protein
VVFSEGVASGYPLQFVLYLTVLFQQHQ